jgi:dihydrofolate reductase
MRRIIVSQFVSLDGVTEDPHKWSFPFWHDDIGKFKENELFIGGVDTLLLGRVTYDGFADAWPSRTGEFADRMNNIPKVVVSTTLEKPAWNNTTVIKKNVAEEVSKLKQAPGEDLMIYGSMSLVDTLMSHDLVDEYRLLVFPLVLGNGKRLFKDGRKAGLTLAEAKSYDTGVVLLRYDRANGK